MSFILLVGLIPHWNSTNLGISPVLEEMYFWSLLDIHGMLVHYFQIIMNFFYVSQSTGWRTSLLILQNYRDISRSWWHILLKCCGEFLGIFLDAFNIIQHILYVCQSVSWLTSLLKLDKYRDISGSGWDIFLKFLETFLGCCYTISKYFWNSCMSVSLLFGLLPYLN